jgi:NAD(P) transhydrogenase subunit alpha
VIVDLAAATGGNCALTQNGKTILHGGVTIIGLSDLPSRMPRDASKLFSNNVLNYFKHVFKNGPDQLNYEDQITAETLIGEVPATAPSE